MIKIEEVLERNPYIPNTRLWYKYNGHSGYYDDWFKRETCFSTICKDNTKSLIKIPEPRKITEKEWNRMVIFIKKVSTGVRRCLNENPPCFDDKTMFFGSGSGYNDYLAFVLFRMFAFDPKHFNLIMYLHYHHKYTLHDSYILSKLFHRSDWYRILSNGNLFHKGSAVRLRNCGRRVARPYGMEYDIKGRECAAYMGLPLTEEGLNDKWFIYEVFKYINDV